MAPKVIARNDQGHADVGLQAQRTNQAQVVLVLCPLHEKFVGDLGDDLRVARAEHCANAPPGLRVGWVEAEQFLCKLNPFRVLVCNG